MFGAGWRTAWDTNARWSAGSAHPLGCGVADPALENTIDQMNTQISQSISRAGAVLSLTLCCAASQAAVTTYTSVESYTAVATTNLLATFEGLPSGSLGLSLEINGITIISLPGGGSQHDVYIAPTNSSLFAVQNSSEVLTANGDENFRFQLTAGGTFTAIGFDFYSNPYDAPIFTFYDSSSSLIASVTVPQAPSSLGFIGLTSTTPIAYMTSTTNRGWSIDNGFDNLQVGVSAVPEPATLGLWVAGLVGVAALTRKRSR